MFKGKIGVEIEGFLPLNKREDVCNSMVDLGWNFGGDGSIIPPENNHGVEFRSEVYSLENLDELFNATQKLFKDLKVNNSCGLHIHLSFKDLVNYYKISEWGFVEQFQNNIIELFKTETEKKRLTNHFCALYKDQKDFNDSINMCLSTRCKGGYRYKAVNYNAYSLYRTIEFRIFPATYKIENFKKYVMFLVNNVNNFIDSNQLNPVDVQCSNIKQPKPLISIRMGVKK